MLTGLDISETPPTVAQKVLKNPGYPAGLITLAQKVLVKSLGYPELLF
jgi:hypothetical protein